MLTYLNHAPEKSDTTGPPGAALLSADGALAAEALEGHTKVVSVWRDVTDRRAAEEALQGAVVDTLQHAAQLRGLSEAALAINAALTLDVVWRVTTDQARTIIGAQQAAASLTVNQDWGQEITAISASGTYIPQSIDDDHPDESDLYALVCRDNRPMRLTQEELEAHLAWHGFGWAKDTHLAIRGWLAAPLIGRDGRNMGLIQLSNKSDGEFTENDEAIIAQLAHMASIAVENARLSTVRCCTAGRGGATETASIHQRHHP